MRAFAVDDTLAAVVEPALLAADAEARRERRATWDAMARPNPAMTSSCQCQGPNPAMTPFLPMPGHGVWETQKPLFHMGRKKMSFPTRQACSHNGSLALKLHGATPVP